MEINGYGNRHFTGKMVAEDGSVILLLRGGSAIAGMYWDTYAVC